MQQTNKSLPLAYREAMRAWMARVVDEDFEGDATRAAEGLKLAQSTVSNVRNGKTGAGTKVIIALWAHTQTPIEEILTRAAEAADRQPAMDPKETVKATYLYRIAHPDARRAFDDLEPLTALTGVERALAVERYTRRLLECISDQRIGALAEPPTPDPTPTPPASRPRHH